MTEVQHSTECHLLIGNEQGDFLAGAMAALVNISITFPINKIMFRQMVHGVRTPTAVNQVSFMLKLDIDFVKVRAFDKHVPCLTF